MNSFGDAAGMEVGPLNGHVKHMEQGNKSFAMRAYY